MNFFTIFLRGLLMGACDIVPGISGGTIAFITGIYDRLLNALGNLSSLKFKLLKKGNFKGFLKPLDLKFLIPLVLGIFLAIITISKLMIFLLDKYPSLTLSFFVGLILASALTLFTHVKQKNKQTLWYVLAGLFLGVLFSFLPEQISISTPLLWYVFIGGFFAITAMILPGISGSFILLVLGLYSSTLLALHNFNIMYLMIFSLGAISSLLFVTNGIKKLLTHHKNKMMSFLSGLVLGTLLVPLKQVSFGYIEIGLMIFGIIISLLMSTFRNK